MNGLKYISENKLVNDFKRTYEKKDNGHFVFFEEIKTGWGKPDLIVINYDKGKLLDRIQNMITHYPIPSFSNIAAYSMYFLSRVKKTTVDDLKNFLKIKSINGLLASLEKRGLVYIYKNNKISIKSKERIFYIKSIKIYEAKIRNWRRAIYQAQRHLWFTNDSYIIMPLFSQYTSKKVEFYCKKAGIGLILQESKNSFRTVTKPPKNGLPGNSYMAWKLNELLADKMAKSWKI